MNAPLWVAVPLVALMMLATRADVRSRRIPNLLVGPALALALVAHAALGGWAGFTGSLAGMLVAGGLLLPGHLARWMGAGDVKLMAAVGAWLAWPLALVAVLAALVAGGLVSLAVAVRRRMLVRTLHGAAAIGFWTLMAPAGPAGGAPAGSGVRFPFAVAAAAGVLFALTVRL
jgi:prepilin peptidase CpaA